MYLVESYCPLLERVLLLTGGVEGTRLGTGLGTGLGAKQTLRQTGRSVSLSTGVKGEGDCAVLAGDRLG